MHSTGKVDFESRCDLQWPKPVQLRIRGHKGKTKARKGKTAKARARKGAETAKARARKAKTVYRQAAWNTWHRSSGRMARDGR